MIRPAIICFVIDDIVNVSDGLNSKPAAAITCDA